MPTSEGFLEPDRACLPEQCQNESWRVKVGYGSRARCFTELGICQYCRSRNAGKIIPTLEQSDGKLLQLAQREALMLPTCC